MTECRYRGARGLLGVALRRIRMTRAISSHDRLGNEATVSKTRDVGRQKDTGKKRDTGKQTRKETEKETDRAHCRLRPTRHRVPIFAFTTAACGRGGIERRGFGRARGARLLAEELKVELDWLDEHVGRNTATGGHRDPRQVTEAWARWTRRSSRRNSSRWSRRSQALCASPSDEHGIAPP